MTRRHIQFLCRQAWEARCAGSSAAKRGHKQHYGVSHNNSRHLTLPGSSLSLTGPSTPELLRALVSGPREGEV
ncbi:hypothetical protein ACZ87_03219 [Candidatus Erwinia dacicola]|uniref:Uncharacterized protein n=1 Tax=Candidatus Erwinia dacicola TaxID=252393 RepID=A0A328TLX5_9GAMM|nr:hypothetical protein ACZ87_03219 [Candidatus Erwinia dacicola]